jgi:uncharacterized protein (DUF1501 family)
MTKPKLTPSIDDDLLSSSRRVFLKQSSYLGLGSVAIANSLGISSLLNIQPAIAADDDFKALVFIFLAGGNDAFNMIPPKGEGPLRTRYETSRGAVALPADQLHTLTPQNTAKIDGDDEYNAFGMHPGCGDMAEMFNNQDMSVIFNMGNLYEPTSVEQIQAKSVTLPPQLYSHSDQQRQLQSEPTNNFSFGWGGRAAELLASNNTDENVSSLISVSGLNSFQVTQNSIINPFVMGNTGTSSIDNYNGDRESLVDALMSSENETAEHLMAKKYRDTFNTARRAEAILNTVFEQAQSNGIDYDGIFANVGNNSQGNAISSSSIAKQLKTIAKLIAGKANTANKRPIYYVKMGGFDNHAGLLSNHLILMEDLNGSLKAFADCLKAQGDFDNCLSLVTSEFARTFTPNGNDENAGTDHAWGGHALVMGGSIEGGRFFGSHPDLKVGEGIDTSSDRGRWIPSTSTSQCAAVAMKWFGVDENSVNTIFPSLSHFPSPFESAANIQFMQQEDV